MYRYQIATELVKSDKIHYMNALNISKRLEETNPQKYKYKLVEHFNIPFPYKALYKDTCQNTAPHFSQVLKNTTTELTPEWRVISHYNSIKATTEIFFENEYSPLKPTFVFHHGLLITNHLQNVKVFTSKDFYKMFNVVSIKMAWHKNVKEGITIGLSSWDHILLMIASSVLSMEEVVKFHKKVSDKKVVLCGTSMGGIVASNHFFYLNTADFYFPLVAFPNFGRMLLRDKYKSLIANFDTVNNLSTYLECMDVPNDVLSKANKAKCFLILAENDELVDFEESRKFWKGYNVMTTQTGHFDIIKDREKIRNLIMDKIEK